MYQDRFYRQYHRKSLCTANISYKASDIFISADTDIDTARLKEYLVLLYTQIEEYVSAHPRFHTALTPCEFDDQAPEIIQDMLEASGRAGVGPFASVAGAIAAHLGRRMIAEGHHREVIVENGGDLFLKIQSPKRLGVYVGASSGPEYITLRLPERHNDFGVASSSATIGHSLNFGKADLVTVVARDALYADAFATALSNEVKSASDVAQVLEKAKKSALIYGILVVVEGTFSLWGDFEIER